MYVIIVYDVGVDRVNKIKAFLRQYLHWVQNSVFEGDLTESEYMIVKDGIKNIIDTNADSVIVYKSRYNPNKEVFGIEKNELENIL